MTTLGTIPTKTVNLKLVKGQYREFDFDLPWLTQTMVDTGIQYYLSWWGLYVRQEEDGEVLTENSKKTEEDAGRVDWVWAEKKVTVKFHSEFSYTVPKGTPTQRYDISLMGLFGKRMVPVRGTFEFDALITRDDDTEAQVWNSSEAWTTDFCAELAKERTALLGIPETGTTLSSTAGAATVLIHVVDGSIFAANDDIGIELDTDGYHETTVSSVDGNDIYLNAGLPLTSGGASGNGVYKGKCNHVRCGTA